jgi:catechol 2,3-dioxygenase-like lactoylglutathione lyase family enzyme
MKRVLLLLFISAASLAQAQMAPANGAGVSMGHLHLNVREVEASKRFWILLGATPVRFRDATVMKLPNVLIFLQQSEPTGGSAGTVVDHVSVKVKNVPAEIERLQSAGIKAEKGARWPTQAFVTSPELLRIEFHTDDSMPGPIANDHIHLVVTESAIPEIQAWYAKTFGGTAGIRDRFKAVELPGVVVAISAARAPTTPIKGSALDHIGFEVQNLEEFCKKLAASGIKFDKSFTRQSDFSSAVITDPWGTQIELTEGMGRI